MWAVAVVCGGLNPAFLPSELDLCPPLVSALSLRCYSCADVENINKCQLIFSCAPTPSVCYKGSMTFTTATGEFPGSECGGGFRGLCSEAPPGLMEGV